jgi:hypothetical protein
VKGTNTVTTPLLRYSKWHVEACDFEVLKAAVDRGKAGTGPYVIEASTGACNPDESCVAGFLAAASEYTYLACFADSPTYDDNFEIFAQPLGAPVSDAVEGPAGTWTRKFASGTVATWNAKAKSGKVQWSGKPLPPAPPPPPSPPSSIITCGATRSTMMNDTTFAKDDVGFISASSVQECCDACAKQKRGIQVGGLQEGKPKKKCIEWAYHSDGGCHLHGAGSEEHSQIGTVAGVMQA